MFNKAILVAFLSLTLAVNALPREEHRPESKGSSSSAVASSVASATTLAAAESESASCAAASVITVTVTAGAESTSAAAVATTSTAGASTSGSKSSGSKSGSSSSGSKSGSSGSKAGSSSATTSSAASAVSSTAVLANAGNGGGNNNAAAGGSAAAGGNNAAAGGKAGAGDIQSSLTLDPSVIASGFANDGQDVPAAGQVASITSTNNFINFCAGQTITNGKQIVTGSCNPAPMGQIAAQTVMPSAKFVFPKNLGTVQANTPFTIQMAISNLETGNFVNAAENYFAAPQQVNAQGVIVGHSHIVVEPLQSLDQTTPTDPLKFVYFKGLNDAAVNGILTADLTSGLPAGFYKLSSINSAANHQPALVAIAQHGSLDDAVYFTVTDGAAGSAGNATVAGNAGGNATSSAAGNGNGKAKGNNQAAAAAKGQKGKSGGRRAIRFAREQ